MTTTLVMIGPFQGKAAHFLTDFSSEFNIVHTPSALEGYTLIEQESVKQSIAVLLDMFVEDIDGFEALKTIKAKYPIVEVIAIAPEYQSEWAIGIMQMGGYAFETYGTHPSVIKRYLHQISEQFDLFKIAENVCREKLILDMDHRVKLALELLAKRRLEGARLTKEELSVFFPITGVQENAANILNHLNSIEMNSPIQILLVEDDMPGAQMISQVLIGLLGHKVVHVGSIAEAIEEISKGTPFHVAILDIGLPDGRGVDLIQPIVQKSPATEIVMLTAYDDTFHIMTAFQKGASDYILKPFENDHLQVVISKAAQRNIYKSFNPSSNWLPIPYDAQSYSVRMRLLNELMEFRKAQGKDMSFNELDIFKTRKIISRENTQAKTP
jgi:CheY-like chemotaxis protein